MNNKTVLVTGSSRGLGRSIALALAEVGYDVVIHCRSNVEQGLAVVERAIAFGVNARMLQFDVADMAETKAVLEADIETYGVYYGVVCNAGMHDDVAFPAMDKSSWDNVMKVNLDSFYNVLNPLVMPMIQTRKPARIITLSSVSGMMGNRGQVNYSAAKAGVIGATKALSLELAKRKITVNCIAPGIIESDMTEDFPTEIVKQIVPMQRIGKPEEVSSLVTYLLSENASYITRQVISVNGGML